MFSNFINTFTLKNQNNNQNNNQNISEIKEEIKIIFLGDPDVGNCRNRPAPAPAPPRIARSSATGGRSLSSDEPVSARGLLAQTGSCHATSVSCHLLHFEDAVPSVDYPRPSDSDVPLPPGAIECLCTFEELLTIAGRTSVRSPLDSV